MKNNFIKRLLTLAPLCLSFLFTSSCKKQYTYNYDNFFGLCEVCGELSNGVDYALTNVAIANKANAMKAKSFRVWFSVKDCFDVDEEDNITVVSSYYNVMRDHVDKLYEAGIRNFVFMYTTFIFPKGYVPSTGYVVPDPYTEYSTYIRFLNLMGKATAELARLFPEMKIVEPGNEPDPENATCVHKNGYKGGSSLSVNRDYLFTADDKASIISDMCWYCKKYLKDAGNNDIKVAIPGLTYMPTAVDLLDLIYERIESKCLPAGQEKSDTNVDNYFDYLNWHPYSENFDDFIDDEWLDTQNEIYQVAIDHGDDGRPAIFTEFGATDFAYGDPDRLVSAQQHIANNFIDFFNIVRQKMPYVESVYCFRMFTLVHQDISVGENNFGFFYNPDHPTMADKAKPSAKAIAKYFNGDDYDVSILDRTEAEYAASIGLSI